MARMASVSVAKEDQENINTFGRLNNRFHEARGEVDSLKKRLEDLEEAGNEIMISDEEETRYLLGEVFVRVDNDEAEGLLDAEKERAEADVERLEGEITDAKGQMADLKVVLYGKFGKNINLEEE